MLKSFVRCVVLWAGAGWMVALGGCRRPPAPFTPPPPPEVTVGTPVERVIPRTLQFTGVTRAVESVEIRARVKGFLQKKHVEGGRRVKAGDLLFTIDPRTYDAAVKSAQAEVEVARAKLRLAEVTEGRIKDAATSGAVPKQQVDQASADREAAKAQVDLVEAKLRQTELDLEFTAVRSPISGRLGLIPVEEGDLVGANDATLLATVINDDQIYAVYDMDERSLLETRRANNNRRPGEDGRGEMVVRMGLANEEGYPHEGRFHKADSGVNPGSGTIRIESIFDNKDGTLLGGLFVRIEALLGQDRALMVPDVAVLSDQRGKYVWVVGPDGAVKRQGVSAGGVFDRQRAVLSGLTTQDRVIVAGMQRAREGQKVTPKPPAADTGDAGQGGDGAKPQG